MKMFNKLTKRLMVGLLLASLMLPVGQAAYASQAFDTVKGQGIVRVIDGEHFLVTDDGEKFKLQEGFICNNGEVSISGFEKLEDGDHIVYGHDKPDPNTLGGWFGNHYKKMFF